MGDHSKKLEEERSHFNLCASRLLAAIFCFCAGH